MSPRIDPQLLPITPLRARWLAARLWTKSLPAEVKMPTADRDVLERIVFRALFTDRTVSSIFFVGVGGFTAWYPALFKRFRRGFRFATADPDPDQQTYGARGDHRVDVFQSLRDDASVHGCFDVVINNIFGYGIDSPEEQRDAHETAWLLLRPGGLLVLGYDAGLGDLLDRDLVAEAGFTPTHVPGFDRFEVPTGSDKGNTLLAFRKPVAHAANGAAAR